MRPRRTVFAQDWVRLHGRATGNAARHVKRAPYERAETRVALRRGGRVSRNTVLGGRTERMHVRPRGRGWRARITWRSLDLFDSKVYEHYFCKSPVIQADEKIVANLEIL